ncbi:CG0192-related protein [Arthrobacter sp.]|uniref:CG0192-related protein n=1 Tax=Arthrobacter sp. TaxID=1667 RepID=UPI003A8F036F
MAIIHRAQLTPGKQEVVTTWLASQPWSQVSAGDTIEMVGAFRFDDPAGEVGIETHVVRRADGRILQVPLTYRGAALQGAERHLVAEMEHSVLGHRWVYDATADPVYAQALASTILRGQAGAEQYLDVDGTLAPLPSSVVVHGFGDPDAAEPVITTASPSTEDTPDGGAVVTISTDGPTLAVYLTPRPAHGDEGQLTGRWDGLGDSVLLAGIV